jgi:chromosome segregation ATPase
MLDKVREEMEALEAKGIAPSVRAVRKHIGGGSFTDVGEAIRKVQGERDLLNSVRTDLPQALKDKATILSLDFWLASQELANRAIEDVRQGCEARVAAAESQARETLSEVDDAERKIDDLSKKLAEASRARTDLEKSQKEIAGRADKAEARVAAIEAEMKVMRDHAKSREKEMEKAYAGLERMTAALAGTRKEKSAPKPATNGPDQQETAPK